MSNRFIGLYLTILLISNIFFFSIILENSPMTIADIFLGKILNQSCHLLIVCYIVFNKHISLSNSVIICVLTIQLLDIANEITNYCFHESDTVNVDLIFVMSQRLLWIIILVILGTNFISKRKLKNFLNVAFGSLIFLIFLLKFEINHNDQPVVYCSIIILYLLLIYGSNFKDKIFHEVGIGVTFIVMADLAFVFSGFHDDLNWKYLYLLPRLFLNLGEMLILLKILEKYKS